MPGNPTLRERAMAARAAEIEQQRRAEQDAMETDRNVALRDAQRDMQRAGLVSRLDDPPECLYWPRNSIALDHRQNTVEFELDGIHLRWAPRAGEALIDVLVGEFFLIAYDQHDVEWRSDVPAHRRAHAGPFVTIAGLGQLLESVQDRSVWQHARRQPEALPPWRRDDLRNGAPHE